MRVLRPVIVASLALFGGGTAYATVFAFTSNEDDDVTQRLFLDIKGLANVPCWDDLSERVWISGGRTFGIAFDAANDMVWASGSGALNADWGTCNAGASTYCAGAAYYELGSGGGNEWFDTTATMTDNVVDIVGQGTTTSTRYLVAHKSIDAWWNDGDGISKTTESGDELEPSQLSAFDTTYAVGTVAGTASSCDGAGSAKVSLLQWGASGVDELASATDDVGSDKFKPEGVYVRDIVSGPVCTYTAVAYITDFCGATGTDGRIYVYGITLGGSPSLTETDVLTLPSGCKPSTVTYHPGADQLFVLCQAGETIVPITLNNPCNLDAVGEEVALKFADVDSPEPSCSVNAILNSCVTSPRAAPRTTSPGPRITPTSTTGSSSPLTA